MVDVVYRAQKKERKYLPPACSPAVPSSTSQFAGAVVALLSSDDKETSPIK